MFKNEQILVHFCRKVQCNMLVLAIAKQCSAALSFFLPLLYKHTNSHAEIYAKHCSFGFSVSTLAIPFYCICIEFDFTFSYSLDESGFMQMDLIVSLTCDNLICIPFRNYSVLFVCLFVCFTVYNLRKVNLNKCPNTTYV